MKKTIMLISGTKPEAIKMCSLVNIQDILQLMN